MQPGRATGVFDTLTVFFLALTAFVCLCAFLLMARIVQPPAMFRPPERAVPALAVLPSDTPSPTPSRTATPSRTHTPTYTATGTDTPTPTNPPPTETQTPSATLTASETPLPTATASLTPTPPPTEAPTLPPSATATPTLAPPAATVPTATATPDYPFQPVDATAQFMPYVDQADCFYQGLSGLVFGLPPAMGRLTTDTGLRVYVWADTGFSQEAPIDVSERWGWLVQVDNKTNALTYYVEVRAPDGTVLSPQVIVSFPNDCARNLAVVHFMQTRPF